jgi:hypothetical protein
MHGVANQVFGGWKMSGVLTLQTGLPYTPVLSIDDANTGVGSQHPDIIAPLVQPDTVGCWYYTTANPTCTSELGTNANWWAYPPGVDNPQATYRYGTGGRNVLRADGLKDLDFTLSKTFKITESKSLEFRSEFFNLTNHPTFSAPGTSVNASSGGAVTSVLDAARQIQLALKLYF